MNMKVLIFTIRNMKEDLYLCKRPKRKHTRRRIKTNVIMFFGVNVCIVNKIKPHILGCQDEGLRKNECYETLEGGKRKDWSYRTTESKSTSSAVAICYQGDVP